MSAYTILTADGVADAGQPIDQLAGDLAKPQAKLLLHLHGGLIDEAAGKAIAKRLSGDGPQSWNCDDSWTEVYVVWRTGAFETIRNNWTELAHDDRLYQTIVRKLIGFVARKLGLPGLEGRSAGTAFGLSDEEIHKRITGQRDLREPFEDFEKQLGTAPLSSGRATLAPEESNASLALEFQNELGTDAEFANAAADIDAASTPAAGRAGLAGDPVEGEATLERLDEPVRTQLVNPAATGITGRGLVTVTTFLLEHAGKIALRCFKRIRSGRDHGLHATIVEEVCRELYGDLVGAKVWGFMVQDAADHFKPNGFGTQLIGALPGHSLPFVTTAHSAGSIWATRMLMAIQSAGLSHRINLFLLAPAVRQSLFAEMLGSSSALIDRCFMFAMRDDVERRDAVLGHDKGYIYPSSLLYLVSGLFEERNAGAYADAPLVGMQRFHGAAFLEPAEAADAHAVAAFFQQPDRGIYLADMAGVTESTTHGGFDDDAATLKTARALFG